MGMMRMNKIKLNIVISDAANNMNITLAHTGITYPTKTIFHQVEIELPDLPQGFAIDSITIAGEGGSK